MERLMGDRVAGPDPTRIATRDDLARELTLLRLRAAVGTLRVRVSLTALARLVGLPRSTVHAYVSGKHVPPSDVLDRLVIALGATRVEQRQWNEAWFRVCAPSPRPRHLTCTGRRRHSPVGVRRGRG